MRGLLKSLCCFLLSFCFIFQIPIYAQSTEEQDLLELQKLLFMDVTDISSSTKKVQSIQEAPSIMTVITKKDLALTGARTLADALRTVVGIEMQHGAVTDQIVAIRGIRSRESNGKVLFMVDGHPMNNPATGDWNVWGLAGIKQIEIIRGPGSALYGDHAFEGVINIITENGKDIDGVQVSTGAGTEDSYHTSLVIGKEFETLGSKFDARFRFEHYDTNGYDDTIIKEDRSSNYWDPIYDAFGPLPTTAKSAPYTRTPNPGFEGKYFQYFDFKLNWMPSENIKSYFWYISEESAVEHLMSQASSYLSSDAYVKSEKNWRIILGSEVDLEEFGKLNIRAWHEELHDKQWGPQYPNDIEFPYATPWNVSEHFPEGARSLLGKTSVSHGIDFNHEFKLIDTDDFTADFLYGASINDTWQKDAYNETQGSPSPYGPTGTEYSSLGVANFAREVHSAYTQLMVGIGPSVNVILGGRYDKYDDADETFNPRSGIVWSPFKDSYLKLLYSTAFRAPSLDEAQGLLPEEIKTTELNFSSSYFKRLRFSSTVFHSKLDNIIGRTSVYKPATASFTNITSNFGRIKVLGTETEIEYSLTDNLLLFANHAYLDTEQKMHAPINATSSLDITLPYYAQPKHKFHFGYKLSLFKDKFNWYVDMFSAEKRSRSYMHNLYGKDDADRFVTVNTNFLFKNIADKSVDFNLAIFNLFDEEYEASNDIFAFRQGGTHYGMSGKNDVSEDFSRGGISVYAGLKYQF